MEELQIFNAQTQSYVANGLFQIAVVIGVFIVFRAARFARQNNIAAKVLVSLFGLVISFFSLNIGSLRPQIEKNIINTPIKAVKIKNHFFELMFSFNINALARIPKGIAN